MLDSARKLMDKQCAEIVARVALEKSTEAASVHPVLERIAENNADRHDLRGPIWYVKLGYIWSAERFKRDAATQIAAARRVRFHRAAGTWHPSMKDQQTPCIAHQLNKAGQSRREALRILTSINTTA